MKSAWADGKFDGAHQTPQCLRKCSKAGKNNWKDSEYREKVINGITKSWQDPRRRADQSKSMKEKWANGILNATSFHSPTKPEIAIHTALNLFGIEYQTEYRPKNTSKPYDIFIPPNILIEIQGDYWHNRPGMPERDAKKSQWAKNNSYQLVAIWEHEIKKHGADKLVEQRITPLMSC